MNKNNEINFGGRIEILRALVGSHNYNLNTPESDKDYKVFVIPTFDDLYFNRQFSKTYIGETEDLDVHDIRKLNTLLWKSNINFLEVLFSDDIVFNKDKKILPIRTLFQAIFSMKDDIARMNIPYLWNACIGMHITKKKQIDKGTEGTNHLVEKYGYDTKQAMHSLRVLMVLRRFAENNFTDFKEAITFKDSTEDRELLLNIKNGHYSREEIAKLLDDYLLFIKSNFEEKYLTYPVDNDTNEKLLKLVKDIVTVVLIHGY